ncbi:unnamed protein product [Triticum turgidum subsp. durum]|uniref:Uncharacterized protein n=2 Tax=Triticum TaxID=4564 RepID=A0A9R0R5Y1_TRITD|nr:unnamed protein product [Triticum turgidum subsp. durum]
MRVGYYVNNDYDEEQLREEPPAKLLLDRVQRNILADKPRVTKFPINFHPEPGTSAEQPQQDAEQQQQPTSPEPQTAPVEPQMAPLENVTCDEIKPIAAGQ